MKKSLLFVLVINFVVCVSAATPGRFMSFPDINGNKIVFTYENDLWTVSSAGGIAVRLTSHPGAEYAAKISPDGKWIAFTGSYDQGGNVYVMSIDGGVPKRLTWSGPGQVVGWSVDSQKVVFRSALEFNFRPNTRLYTVDLEGQLPEALPVPRGVLCSFSIDGKQMVYNPRGNEEYYWKRYKGGQYQDIWLYDFTAKSFTKLTDYVGKNSYPMWVGQEMLFTSDRGERGVANLFRYDFTSKKVTQLTHYLDTDIQMPSTDGKQVIYLYSGFIHVFDPATGKSRKVDIQIPSDRWQLAERTVNPSGYIHSMAPANDGKAAVFEARGDIFLVPLDKNDKTRNLTNRSSSRERFPQLSPDGKRVAFFSDRSGEYELYVMSVDGEEWTQLTNGMKTAYYHLEWSPDGKKILFGNKDFTIFYVDVDNKKVVKVDSSNQMKNDEFYWEVSDYSWSPDSNWIVYSFVQYNRNNRIFLYSLAEAKSYPLTTDFYDSLNPSFDANGKYLYFLSYRNYDVQMDLTEDNHIIANPVQVMVVQLRAGQLPPFFKAPKPAPSQKDKDKESAEAFRIDLDGIEQRISPLPIKSGNYFFLKAGKGKVTWAAINAIGEDEFEEVFNPRGQEKWELHVFDMDSEKEVTLEGKISDWRMSANRENMLIKKGGDYLLTGLEKAFGSKSPGEKLALDKMVYTVKPSEEWAQIFNDTWRWYRDFFYDADMHGTDWNRIGENYKAWLPQLSSRQELNWLLSQMVGELCVSHTYVGGGDVGPQRLPENPRYTGYLGADLQPDPSGRYRLVRIFGPDEFSRDITAPLVRPDIEVKAGDFLLAIDGHEIKTPENPHRYLQVTQGQKVSITVNAQPSLEGARTYEVEPVRSEMGLRYTHWLGSNIRKVLTTSNGDIGYLHITGMGAGNTTQFDKFWRAFRYKKGLVIDVRGNGGGWTEYFLIDKLERQQVGYNVLRNMVPFRYPGGASMAKYAVLTNEANGSDGEAFVEHFKACKLGTVIGVPSWGGLVGILNTQTTIDNGRVEQSNNAFFGKEGKWWVENHGADPDILLDNDPASAMAGHDLQLEKAIEVLLQQIKGEKEAFPPHPAYPKKAGGLGMKDNR